MRETTADISLLLGLLFSAVFVSAGQAQSVEVKGWVGGGLGLIDVTRTVHRSARVDIYVLVDEIALGARWITIIGDPSDSERRGILATFEDVRDVGMVIGYAPATEGSIQFVVASGPAVVCCERETGNFPSTDWLDFKGVVGLAVEAGVFGRFVPGLGYRLTAYANLNEARSFAGVTLGLTLGR